MKARDDSMTVTGTVHDRKFTAMTFSSSYLYLLSKIVFHFFLINAVCTLKQISVISHYSAISILRILFTMLLFTQERR